MAVGTHPPGRRPAPTVDLTAALLVLGAVALALAALATGALGGVHLQAGPLRVSISSPLRPAGQALALLLLREARGACASLGSRLGFLGLLAALLALAGGLGLVGALGARCFRADTAALVALTGVYLLFVVAMTANANHGGTRDMSRYGLWLVPLCVPLLRALDAAGPRARRRLLLLAAWSVASGLGDHHPARASRYLEPTPLAGWLWRRWPAATNPLPEVFAERTSGSEERDLLPAATEGCEKALVVGDGSPLSVWPLRCRPAELPPPCRAAGVYCYANRREGGYSFVRAPRQPASEGIRPAAWYWSGAPSPPLLRVVTAAARDATREAGPRGIERLMVSARGLGRVRARVGGETVLLWIDRPRRRAGIVLGPDPRRRVLLVDPRRARLIASHALDSAVSTRIALPRVSPLLLVVLPVSRVPPGIDEALPPAAPIPERGHHHL